MLDGLGVKLGAVNAPGSAVELHAVWLASAVNDESETWDTVAGQPEVQASRTGKVTVAPKVSEEPELYVKLVPPPIVILTLVPLLDTAAPVMVPVPVTA